MIGETILHYRILANAIKNGYQNYEWIKRDPNFDSIRNQPSYIELMKDKN